MVTKYPLKSTGDDAKSSSSLMSFQRQTEKIHENETEQIMKKNRTIKKRTCSSFTDNHHLIFAAVTAACCTADNCPAIPRERRCTLNACVSAFCVHSMAQHAHTRHSVAIAINVMEAMEDRRMTVYGLCRALFALAQDCLRRTLLLLLLIFILI